MAVTWNEYGAPCVAEVGEPVTMVGLVLTTVPDESAHPLGAVMTFVSRVTAATLAKSRPVISALVSAVID